MVITANDLKVKGVSVIENLLVAELDNALRD